MWNGLIRIFFWHKHQTIHLWNSSLLNSLLKTSWGRIWNANWASCCPSWSKRRWALQAVQMFVNGFQWLPPSKHFLIQNHFSSFSFRACKYLAVFPPEEHQQSCPFQLKQFFLCPAAASTDGWNLCPRVRLLSSAHSACPEGDGRIGTCAVSYRSEKKRGVCSCFCLTPCPHLSFG